MAGAEIENVMAKKRGGFLDEIHRALFWHPLQRLHRTPNSIADQAAASASPWKICHNRSNFRRNCDTRPSDSPNRCATNLVLSPLLSADDFAVTIGEQPKPLCEIDAEGGQIGDPCLLILHRDPFPGVRSISQSGR